MVLIKSATQRLKMNKFVTVLIFLFSDINKILNVFFFFKSFLTHHNTEDGTVSKDGGDDHQTEAKVPENFKSVIHPPLLLRTNNSTLQLWITKWM